MKKILIIGAGLSSSYLIKYLLTHAEEEKWTITLADADKSHAEQKMAGHPMGKAVSLEAKDSYAADKMVQEHDLVISMLPASMHVPVATACVKHKKHLITASYISESMLALDSFAKDADVILLNECGLDPGIDHMSAIKMIHEVQAHGGIVNAFRSYCGGLIAPEYDDNPWHYKFTWNPRNVVVAGQATARYLEDGILKFIPPSRIFRQIEEVEVKGHGTFECYANRDSLEYIKPYGITSAATVLRGTMRGEGFCHAWDQLVKLGLTDDSFIIHNTDGMTYRDLTNSFTPGDKNAALEERVAGFLGIQEAGDTFSKLKWAGLFDEEKITVKEGSPALLLQLLLQQKWKLNKGELDMIVMHHEMLWTPGEGGNAKKMTSSLVVKGEDEVLTAMSKTVGLPMAIAAKLILSGKIRARGVQIPILQEIYEPVLRELENFGILFNEQSSDIH